MPRPNRLWYPGAWYHVFARGNNKAPIFFEPADYQRYLDLLRQAMTQFGCRLYAYALMTNHVHLLVQTGSEQPLARPMHMLQARYTMYVNRRYERVGHLFQGRYRGSLIEGNTYLLVLSRYIHLNPVRAGLVADPSEYPWSSYVAYLAGKNDDLVTTEFVLDLLSGPPHRRCLLYRMFVEGALGNLMAPPDARYADFSDWAAVEKGTDPGCGERD